MSELQNVEVLFLPPSATSKIQRFDSGIITAVKAKSQHRLLFRVLDKMDSEARTLYNVDILTVLRWVQEKWLYLDEDLISNCWKPCFKFDSAETSLGIVAEIHINLREQVTLDVQETGIQYSRVGFESLLNPEEKDAVTK